MTVPDKSFTCSRGHRGRAPADARTARPPPPPPSATRVPCRALLCPEVSTATLWWTAAQRLKEGAPCPGLGQGSRARGRRWRVVRVGEPGPERGPRRTPGQSAVGPAKAGSCCSARTVQGGRWVSSDPGEAESLGQNLLICKCWQLKQKLTRTPSGQTAPVDNGDFAGGGRAWGPQALETELVSPSAAGVRICLSMSNILRIMGCLGTNCDSENTALKILFILITRLLGFSLSFRSASNSLPLEGSFLPEKGPSWCLLHLTSFFLFLEYAE